jgi:hypothetical protein
MGGILTANPLLRRRLHTVAAGRVPQLGQLIGVNRLVLQNS